MVAMARAILVSAVAAAAATILLPAPRVVFLGVAGPSGVGKSTLAGSIAREVSSPMEPICLDYFYRETPLGIDFPAILAAMHKVAETLESSTTVPDERGRWHAKLHQVRFCRQSVGTEASDRCPRRYCDEQLCKMITIQWWLEVGLEGCMSRRRQ